MNTHALIVFSLLFIFTGRSYACTYIDDKTLNEAILQAHATLVDEDFSIVYKGIGCGDIEANLDQETLKARRIAQAPSREGFPHNRGLRDALIETRDTTYANVQWAKDKNEFCRPHIDVVKKNIAALEEVKNSPDLCTEERPVVQSVIDRIQEFLDQLEESERLRNLYIQTNTTINLQMDKQAREVEAEGW